MSVGCPFPRTTDPNEPPCCGRVAKQCTSQLCKKHCDLWRTAHGEAACDEHSSLLTPSKVQKSKALLDLYEQLCDTNALKFPTLNKAPKSDPNNNSLIPPEDTTFQTPAKSMPALPVDPSLQIPPFIGQSFTSGAPTLESGASKGIHTVPGVPLPAVNSHSSSAVTVESLIPLLQQMLLQQGQMLASQQQLLQQQSFQAQPPAQHVPPFSQQAAPFQAPKLATNQYGAPIPATAQQPIGVTFQQPGVFGASEPLDTDPFVNDFLPAEMHIGTSKVKGAPFNELWNYPTALKLYKYYKTRSTTTPTIWC